MAYSEAAAARIRKILGGRRGITEKKMFGGLSFLLRGKMVCGLLKDDLVVRVTVDDSAALIKKSHVRPMDFTGRPMKGFLYVGPPAYRTEKSLRQWIERSIDTVSAGGRTDRRRR